VALEQGITDLVNQTLDPDIAQDFKLAQQKAPAVNEQIAKIVHGLMREKLSEEVLTETLSCYNRPDNCESLITTKVIHLIGNKLKPETRSNDIQLQKVQANLVKGIIPMVSIVQSLVEARG
jgi:hypothetical protein